VPRGQRQRPCPLEVEVELGDPLGDVNAVEAVGSSAEARSNEPVSMYGTPAASNSAAKHWMTASGPSAEAIELDHELVQRLAVVWLALARLDSGEGKLANRLAHSTRGQQSPFAAEAALGFGLRLLRGC
jgi:hypothetical protein